MQMIVGYIGECHGRLDKFYNYVFLQFLVNVITILMSNKEAVDKNITIHTLQPYFDHAI